MRRTNGRNSRSLRPNALFDGGGIRNSAEPMKNVELVIGRLLESERLPVR
jgi:hypothetical protein